MSIFLQSLMPPSPGLALPIKADGNSMDDSSFSSFLGQVMTRTETSLMDKLGLAGFSLLSPSLADSSFPEINAARSRIEPDLPELLDQFLADIAKIADENVLLPGQWQVVVPDPDVLQDLALYAGMDEVSCRHLLQQVDKNGVLELSDLLATLRNQMTMLAEAPLVAVPETELPFLETMMTRVGVERGQVVKLLEGAVRGDEKIDLRLLLAGLKQYYAEKVPAQDLALPQVDLGGSELKTLQNLLEQAGVRRSRQVELLPELFTFTPQRSHSDLSVAPESFPSSRLPFNITPVSDHDWGRMSLERLIKFIEAGVADNNQQVQIDLPAFLRELENIFQQAGMAGNGREWSPVVQGSMVDVFQALAETIDLSQVRIRKSPFSGSNHFVEQAAMVCEGSRLGALSEDIQLVSPVEDSGPIEALFSSGLEKKEPGYSFVGRNSNPVETAWLPGMRPLQPLAVAGGDRFVVDRPVGAESLHNQQQQVIDQVSSTIGRGLARQEHHLLLHLHPRELGEVRIELVVRNEQVNVMFSPENNRVREILESGLDQFRSQMEDRGFVLNGCNVGDGRNEGESGRDVGQENKSFYQKGHVGRDGAGGKPDRQPLARPQVEVAGKINLVV